MFWGLPPWARKQGDCPDFFFGKSKPALAASDRKKEMALPRAKVSKRTSPGQLPLVKPLECNTESGFLSKMLNHPISQAI